MVTSSLPFCFCVCACVRHWTRPHPRFHQHTFYIFVVTLGPVSSFGAAEGTVSSGWCWSAAPTLCYVRLSSDGMSRRPGSPRMWPAEREHIWRRLVWVLHTRGPWGCHLRGTRKTLVTNGKWRLRWQHTKTSLTLFFNINSKWVPSSRALEAETTLKTQLAYPHPWEKITSVLVLNCLFNKIGC